jgi:hypothetical protein
MARSHIQGHPLAVACVVGAVGLVALAWACYVVFAPRVRVSTGESDPDVLALHAWAEPAQASLAALAVDGRRGGSLPFAWQAVGRASLHLERQHERGVAGVVVSWQGTPPTAATMHLGARSVPLEAADVHGETVLWLDAPQPVTRVSLDVQDAAVAEVQLLTDAAPIWLIAPRPRADQDLELLATYGATNAARIPVGGVVSAPLSHARAIVVSNETLPEAAVVQLRRYVEAGSTLVELGPRSAICGAAVSGEELPAQRFTLAGQTGSGARWLGAFAQQPACNDTTCQSDKVLVTARPEERKAAAPPVEGGALAQPACTDESCRRDHSREIGSATGQPVCADAACQSAAPLVVSRALGAGQCVRWLGDLSLAIRTLRQGDPARAGREGGAAFKPNELFAGPIDDVPSADRLGFALARQLTAASGIDLLVAPLPAAGEGLVVYTADQDFVPGAGELARSESAKGVGMTLTLTAADIGGKPDIVYPEASEPVLEPKQVEQLAARGHSVGIHPNLVGVSTAQYAQVIEAHVQRFRERYGVAPRIVRNHHLIWQGYATMAEILARAGLSLDLDYVSIPAGFMTGSGLPMRFVDHAGYLIPIYQQATQLDDSAFIPEDPATLDATTQRLSARLTALLATAQREHIPLTLLHHSHWWFRSGGRLQSTLLAESNARHMTVWGAAEWLSFTEARRNTVVRRKGLGFEVDVSADRLALLIEGARQVRVDGKLSEPQRWHDATGHYLFLPLERGRHLIEP